MPRPESAGESEAWPTLSLPGGAGAAPGAGAQPELAGYDLLGELGRGGFGIVYRARHRALGREVAVKMLLAGPVPGERALARFRREAQTVARLQHPNIAQLYEAGESAGRPWLALEYVDGGTLSERNAGKPQPPRAAAELVQTLARAIDYSHAQGVLHRDLKPGNVLLTREGTPKITDFGFARWLETDGGEGLSLTGEIMGTPAYMAPEQASGVVKKLGPASDVYALGAVLYELLTGRPPFHGPDPVQTLQLVLLTEPVAPRQLQPRAPVDLETICLRCLEKEPHRRYPSADALADDLQRFLRGQPIVARPIRWWGRAAKWAKRKPAVAALIGVVALSLAVTAIGGTWYNLRLRDELARSERLFGDGRALARWVLFDHTDALARNAGNTQAREALARRLRDYLDGLALQAGDDLELVADIAAAYERVAAVQGDPNHFNVGRPLDALATYDRALELRARLRDVRTGELTPALNWMLCRGQRADVLAALERTADATVEYREILRSLDALAARWPDARDVAMVRALMLGRFGELLHARGDLDGAHRAIEDSLAALTAVQALDPADQQARREVAIGQARLGRILEAHGDLDGARRAYEKVLGAAEQLADLRPGDALARYDLSFALIAYADILVSQNDAAAALQSYERALDLRRAHAQADAASNNAQRHLVVALERVGTARFSGGNAKGAESCLREGLQLAERLAALPQSLADDRRNVWILHDRLGDLCIDQGRLDDAQGHYAAALEFARALAESGGASDLQGLAQAHFNLGTVALRRVDGAEREVVLAGYRAAADAYRASLELFARIEASGPLQPDQQSLRAVVAQRLVLIEQQIARLER